jgi:hypothetical protein
MIAGVATVIARHGGNDRSVASARSAATSGSASTSPTPTATGSPGNPAAAADVTADGYYAAVKRGDAHAAYVLLCQRQQLGYAAYAARVARNVRTGTGITNFRRTGVGTVRGKLAAVPGEVDLANGSDTPIVVLLVEESGGWRVCSSNLGGVLPGPGTPPVPSQSASPGTSI